MDSGRRIQSPRSAGIPHAPSAPRGCSMTRHSAVYVGTVVHKRLRPREHALSYRVFALLLDLDEIPPWPRGFAFFPATVGMS
ncbi:MAG: hypothetical protein C0511_04665 [Hyphomicrobium sp.]|nr:hypothetical protein [Hyphomicrobium sp.]PPC82944.1 MAG: hypothetical protein CTY40_03535 [Hyphomicrobium sp.]